MASSLYSSNSHLSRSASSVGERQSQTFSIPLLPKRAETFSGFDQASTNQDGTAASQPIVKEIDLLGGNNGEEQFELLSGNNALNNTQMPSSSNGPKVAFDEASISALSSSASTLLPPPLLSLDPHQQQAAFQMTHYLNTLMCMVSEHFTSLESLQSEVAEMKEKSRMAGGRYIQNEHLEEIRYRQNQLETQKKQLDTDRNKQLEAAKREYEEMNIEKAELEQLRKDVHDQRDQLYRKIEKLKDQGIEFGPNLNVINFNAPYVNHSLHTNNTSAIPAPSDDKSFYHGDHSSPDGVAGNQGTGLMPHNSSSSSIGVRKASSMSGVSSGPIPNQASTVATGGSLKKDSFSTNLHLLSATNETKQSVVGIEKHEIQQKIPEKLVSKLSVSTRGSVSSSRLPSMGSERMSKKNLASSSSGISPSGERGQGANVVGNIAKPDHVSQLLPFKLSEASKESAQQQQYLGHGSNTQQGSPGRQKLSSSSFGDSSSTSKLTSLSQHQPQYTSHQPQLQNSACYQYPQNQHKLSPSDQMSMSMRQRTGSTPHLATASLVPSNNSASMGGGGSGMYSYKQMRQPPTQQIPQQLQSQQRNNSNTLPKKDGKQQKEMQKTNYNSRMSMEGVSRQNDKHKGGNGEDKVIYF